jgi:hypothetical protein
VSKKIIALCSCPRLGFMDFMGLCLVSLVRNNVTYANLFGAYWAQALSEGIRTTLSDYDYFITTDYDSLYTEKDVATLIRLIKEHPEADAIASLQQGRFNGALLSGDFDLEDLKNKDLVPASTAHFGLTIFRKSAFDRHLRKPWFYKTPDRDGDWKSNCGKVDEDIFFWNNFKASGKHLFLAPRVCIGHLELLALWPDAMWNESYQTLAHFREHGKPEDAWK